MSADKGASVGIRLPEDLREALEERARQAFDATGMTVTISQLIRSDIERATRGTNWQMVQHDVWTRLNAIQDPDEWERQALESITKLREIAGSIEGALDARRAATSD